MDLNTILIQFCLVSAVITYGLGIFVFAKNSSSPINRLFCIVMILASYWAVGEYFIWQAVNYQEKYFWLKASSFWTVVIVMTVHFILTFINHPLSKRANFKYLILFFYTPAIIIALTEILTETIYTITYFQDSGYYYTPVFDSPIYIAESLYFFLVMTWGIYIGYQSWQHSPKEKIRKQGILVSIGFLLILGFGTQSVTVLPTYGIHIPNLVFIGIVFFSVIITYAIVRFDLFTLGPETAATNIIKVMPDGLILADMDGTIQTVNASGADIFKMEIQELTGQGVYQFLQNGAYPDIVRKILDSETVSDQETILTGPNQRVVSIAGSLVRDPEGDPAGIILIIRDITSRKEAEKALKIANEKISLLSRMTRHDISNLVSPLYGYLSNLKEESTFLSEDPHFITCLDLVEKIIQQLRFSRQYHEIGMHHPEWISLEDIITSALTGLSPQIVEVSVMVSHVEIYADPLIQKVIYNLLENSIRHGERVTKIWIISHILSSRDLVLIIRDNGIGVKNDEKELIFLLGYGKNTGLGLGLSREILSMTGINISETGRYGEGASFELQIPQHVWRSQI